jgi:hypothetical protein
MERSNGSDPRAAAPAGNDRLHALQPSRDPDRYRSDMRTKLLELADTIPLAPMPAARETMVRAFVKVCWSTSGPTSHRLA